MGMFDYITPQIELPDGASKTLEYQTKSFDCTMSNYVITENGELYREVWEKEWVDSDDAKYPFKGYIQNVEGTYRREYLTDFHGDVIFYNGRVNGKWRDYYARFTNGKLEKMWYKDSDF